MAVDAELWERYLALSDHERTAVEVLAAAHGGLSDSEAAWALAQARVRIRGRKPNPTSTRTFLLPLLQSGLVVGRRGYRPEPALGEAVCRALVREGRFEARAAASADADPVALHSWERYRIHARDLLRELRRAVVLGDRRRFSAVEETWQAAAHHFGPVPSLAPWVTDPLEVEELTSLHPDLSARLLDDVAHDQLRDCAPVPGLRDLLRSLGEAHPEHRGLPALAAHEAILAGDLEEARRVLARPTEETQRRLAGLLALAEGDLQASTRHYAKALAAFRKRLGPDAPCLPGACGLLQPLAFLLQGSKSRVNQATRLVGRFLEAYDVDRGQLLYGFVALEALAGLLGGETAERPWRALHPLAVLLEGLVAHWQGQRRNRKRLAEAAATCEACGYGWLAAELKVLLTGDEGEAVPGTVPLVSHRRRTPAWELRLQALEAAVGLASTAAEERKARVAWFLNAGPDWLDLTPKLQKPTGTAGWSKGRPIALSRLAADPGAVEGLSEHDRRIAACLCMEVSYRGWRGRSVDYTWHPETTWAALADHPAVFAAQPPHEPLRVVTSRPRLAVRPTGRNLTLAVEPAVGKGAPVVVFRPEDGVYEVVVFDEEQSAVARQIGAGLRVPAAASDRVGELLSRVAGSFEVHDGADTTAGTTRAVEADPRIVVRLWPAGEGVRARLVVRPLGEAGPAVVPGEGTGAVLARLGGEVCRTTRDLAEEARRVAALEAGAPELVQAPWEAETRLFDEPARALQLLAELQALEDAVVVEWPEGETLRLRQAVGGRALSLSVHGKGEWFTASGELAVDDELVLGLTDLLALLEQTPGRFVRLEDGAFLALTEGLRQRLDTLARIARRTGDGAHFHRLAAGAVSPLLDEAGDCRTDAAWRKQLLRLDAAEAVDVPLPRSLRAELRPYQHDGFTWLTRLASWGAGACLADDMGLGKTVQALALALTRAPEGPTLVVSPASVCGVWIDEAWRFAPTLHVHRFGPGDRAALLEGLGPWELVVCSYGLLASEVERLSEVEWATVVLDEAQAIKNPNTRRHKAARKLKAAFRLATTGTPIENHLGELWALFSFLNPGLLGSWGQFNERFAGPIEAGNREVRAQLRRLTLPFVLRRTKSAVLADLPPRTDVTVTVELGEAEASLYEAVRRRAVETLEEAGEDTPLQVLAQLTRLRLACCNPRLVVKDGEAPPSAKLAAFEELVANLRAGGHRALVFSQFVRHLALLRERLDAEGVDYLYLDGSTPGRRRDRLVRDFQAGEGDLFLISLRAGGFGLNLTGADYVIHMDPWWNPAVEDQASDRVHRIGQTRPVTVYRLVAQGTVEEKIVALHRDKRDLADRLLADADTAARLSAAELLELLRS